MRDSRFISLYYRDEDKVMRKVPGLQLLVSRGEPYEVYTLAVPIKKLRVPIIGINGSFVHARK